jgi:hypothetical protein
MYEHHACPDIRNITFNHLRYDGDSIVGTYQRCNSDIYCGLVLSCVTILVGIGDYCSLSPLMTSDLFVSKSPATREYEYSRAKMFFGKKV